MMRNLLLLLASILISLGLTEGALRIAKPDALFAKARNPPDLDITFATAEFSTHIHTNKRGLRDFREFSARHDGVLRVVAVGDSFTFGWGVSNGEAWPARLEKLLRERLGTKVEVINAGKPGEDLFGYLRAFYLNVLPLKPDVVVLGFLPGSDCPLEQPTDLRSPEDIGVKIAYNLREAKRGDEPSFYVGRLLRNGLLLPLKAALAAKGETLTALERFRGKRNPVEAQAAREMMAIYGGGPKLQARYDRLVQDGWVAKGLSWEVNPWLLLMAVNQPDFSAHALFAHPETKASMDSQWAVCEGLFRDMDTHSKAAGAKFFLGILPSEYQVDAGVVEFRQKLGFDVHNVLNNRTANDKLEAFCKANNIPCIDTLPPAMAARNEGVKLFYPQDATPPSKATPSLPRRWRRYCWLRHCAEPISQTMRIHTIGHSTRPVEELIALLQAAEVGLLVDVRTVPRSRHNPQFNGETLAGSLAEVGIGYRHMPALGGLRGRRKDGPSPNTFWKNDSFRNYADYAASPTFKAGLAELRALAGTQGCAIMCAESLWWRCHRRIIADYLVAAGDEVLHILGAGKTEPARLTPEAEMQPDGTLVYRARQQAFDKLMPDGI